MNKIILLTKNIVVSVVNVVFKGMLHRNLCCVFRYYNVSFQLLFSSDTVQCVQKAVCFLQ